MDISRYILDKKKVIDTALDRYLPSLTTKPKIIHKAMRYAVFSGGKRIRPVLMIASFEACGGRPSLIMPVACSIELIHTYTLIHDDLPCMDDDDYRRGRLSCHKKFNEDIALLAGDALLSLSFQVLSEAGNVKVIEEISKAIGSLGTIGGQVVDIERQDRKNKKLTIQKQDLDYIARNKTGALFEVAVKAAGIFKGVDRKRIDALGNFGRYLGIGFQLVDDLIDKDGYVEVYGASHVKKMAALFTERAKRNLDIFGKKADRLLEIADLILKRHG